jgi:hypothetical protein
MRRSGLEWLLQRFEFDEPVGKGGSLDMEDGSDGWAPEDMLQRHASLAGKASVFSDDAYS